MSRYKASAHYVCKRGCSRARFNNPSPSVSSLLARASPTLLYNAWSINTCSPIGKRQFNNETDCFIARFYRLTRDLDNIT